MPIILALWEAEVEKGKGRIPLMLTKPVRENMW